jgi:hypothetical protein
MCDKLVLCESEGVAVPIFGGMVMIGVSELVVGPPD